MNSYLMRFFNDLLKLIVDILKLDVENSDCRGKNHKIPNITIN